MRKKGFTLIELLVVIAIIAILAAILFPVFAQAKQAAKKSTSISNQKQISLGIMMYANDNDDVYPRNDDCVINSSLNTSLNRVTGDPTPYCTGAQGFAFRMNHFSWQKWILPYTKSVGIFIHPGRTQDNTPTPSCPQGQWSQCGQVTASYALNAAFTGQLNTWNRANTAIGYFRNSFTGGTQSGIPSPAEAAILLETGNPAIAVAPVLLVGSGTNVETAYPIAAKELWYNEFYTGNKVDSKRAFAGGISIGTADGSARFVSAEKFISRTPTIAELGAGSISSGLDAQGRFTGGTVRFSNVPNLAIQYPMWGLGQ